MNKFEYEFLKELRETKTSYASMIEFCCDSLILNNYIYSELSQNGFDFDIYCGNDTVYFDKDYNEITRQEYDQLEDDGEEVNTDLIDVYQHFIIDEQAAKRLAQYTNEIVYFNEELNLYLLGVTHYGTPWGIVSANWKELDEIEEK